MRKYLMGVALVAISMSIAACNKTEPATNEAVAEEPMANESMDANAAMDMNAVDANAVDANATADANAADFADRKFCRSSPLAFSSTDFSPRFPSGMRIIDPKITD